LVLQDGEEENSLEASALRDMANDDDWGLDELGSRPKTYLAEVEAQAKLLGNKANNIQWGGSASATGGARMGGAGTGTSAGAAIGAGAGAEVLRC
jgi:hypothetical protein